MNNENEIIKLYLSGIGSTTICQLLPHTTKRQILEIIKRNGILRNRNLPLDFYDSFYFENNKWYGFYICQTCQNKIQFYSSTKSALNRNLKKKKECKECSLKKQTGINNPFFNKTHNQETKIKISESRKNKGTGDSNAMSKKEHREKVSIILQTKWKSGLMEDIRKKMSDVMKRRIANGELKGYNRSKAEDEIIEQLKDKFEVIPNFIIETKVFDIYIPKFKLLIEYNGDYWHCNPKKYDENYFNKKKNKTAKEIWEYDNKKLYISKKLGYACEVIWESDYKKNKNIINKIIEKYETNN